MSDLLLQGGHVVDPASGTDCPCDVLVRNGLIAAVERPGTFNTVEVADKFNATGCIVAPGLVDIHVHLREPGHTYKETIATGTAAAAAGGFTTIVAMPNTSPVNDSVESMQWMLDPARGPNVRLFAMPAATVGSHGRELTPFTSLAAAGALGFTDDGKPILEDAVMRAALLAAGQLGLPISQHAEDTRISNSSGINAGRVAFRLGLRGMTVEAEALIVERDLRLLREIEKSDRIRAHLHVQHVSTARAIEAIRNARFHGLHVTCEATPHHFTLTDAAVEYGGQHGEIAFDTNSKMNPPLRAEADRLAVIAGLLDGTIDCIATDHAPHARHEKEVEFERAANGITGLETALGLALRVLHREHRMSLSRVVEVMSTNPARIVNLSQAGSLKAGAWADLILFEADTLWMYDTTRTKSKSRNTPFHGTEMPGRITATLIAGKVTYANRSTPH